MSTGILFNWNMVYFSIVIYISIEGKTVYAIIYPTDIGQFIDNDLITNKNILQTIKEDDNPYIIKYELKL